MPSGHDESEASCCFCLTAGFNRFQAQLAAQAAQLQAFSDRIRALEALQGSSHLSSALQPGSGPMAYADEIVSGQGEAVSQMLEQEVSGGPEVGDGDVRLDCHPAELAEALVQQPVVEASNGKEVGQAEEQGEVVAGSGEGEGLQSGARELEVLASSSDGNKGQEQTQSSSIPEDPPSEHQQGDSQGDISARPRTEAVVQPADEPIESEGQQQSAELQAPATPELAVEPQNLPEAEYAVAQGTHRAPGEAALHVFGAPSGAEDAGGISGASATGDIADRIPLPPPAGHVHDSQPLTAPELSAPSQKDDAFCQEPGETETLEEGVDKDCISGTDPLPGDRELSCNPEPLHVVAAEEPGAAAGSGDQAHLAGTLERPQTCSQAEVVAEAAGAALEIAQDRAEPVEPEEEFHDPAESTHCQQEEC